MGTETGPSGPKHERSTELSEALKDLKEELDTACEGAILMGGGIPLNPLSMSLGALEGNEEAMMQAFIEYFDIDPSNPTVVEEYSTKTTAGMKVDVKMFETNKPGILLRWAQDAKGGVDWEICPEDVGRL